MRQGPHQKRSRGRGNGGRKPHSSPRNHTYDSNGPEVRIRGTAYQVHEKYMGLARDASASGDRIRAENLLQHAEHYLRIIQAEEAAQAEYDERHNGNRNQGGERSFEPRGDRTREDRQASDGSDEDGDGQVVMLNRHSDGEHDSDDRSSDRTDRQTGRSDRSSDRSERSDRQAERRHAAPQAERRQRPSRDEARDDDDADGLQRMMGLGGSAQADGSQASGPEGEQGGGEGDENTPPRRGPLRRTRRPRNAASEPAEASAAPETGETGEQQAAPVRRRRAPRPRTADAEQGTLPVEEESGAA